MDVLFKPNTSHAAALARDIRGRFVGGAYAASLKAAHERMAQDVQRRAIRELRAAVESTGRPQRATRYLEKSIAHERNRLASQHGFSVGIESWLYVQSPAHAYARRIEEGGANPMAAQGNIIGAFWTGTGPTSHGPFVRPGEGGLQGRLTWRRSGGFGSFRVRAADAASRGYRMHEKAGAAFLGSRRMTAIYREEFAKRGINFAAELKSRGK